MTSKALRGSFQTFLEYHCDDRALLVKNFEPLNPFFVFADSGVYGRSVVPDTGELRSAIERATGSPVTRIIGVPAETERFGNHFGDEPSLTLTSVLKERHFSSVISGTDPAPGAFSGLGWRTEPLWKRISDDLGSAVRRSMPERWRDRAWGAIDMSLLIYLGYTLSGNAERSDDLRPLVQLLPAAVPLRRHREDPRAWFVLLF